jgi:hypothetical protein
MRAELEVADIFRRCGPQYRQTHAEGLTRVQRRVMSAIELCLVRDNWEVRFCDNYDGRW